MSPTSKADKSVYMAIKTAAEYTDTHERTIRRLIERGAITGYYITPAALRIRRDELEGYLASVATDRFGGGRR